MAITEIKVDTIELFADGKARIGRRAARNGVRKGSPEPARPGLPRDVQLAWRVLRFHEVATT